MLFLLSGGLYRSCALALGLSGSSSSSSDASSTISLSHFSIFKEILISLHMSACSKELLTKVSSILYDLCEISGKTIFIDRIKIESHANKYTFV